MKIILYGAQGSGKGTVGKILSDKLGIPLVSTGDLLRALKPEDPHYEVMQTYNDYLTHTDTPMNFVLDLIKK